MKEDELQALVAYRLQRAAETLEEARVMQNIEHWNACANRLYYAAFYAVSTCWCGMDIRPQNIVASKHCSIGITSKQGWFMKIRYR